MQNQSAIYWVELYLGVQIHAVALGFTKWYSKYAYAKSADEAEQVIGVWAKQNDLQVERMSTRLAHEQDHRRYTFPHQIVNLPASLLAEEYDRRKYPAEMRDPGQVVSLNQICAM